MGTSVHIPPALLREVDRQARRLKISRNRFILDVLEKELARSKGWPPGFFETFTPLEGEDAKLVDEMLDVIRRNRTSKGPPDL